jgi:hypothetical protein
MTALQNHVNNGDIGRDELGEIRPWHAAPWRDHTCKVKVGDPAPDSKVVKMDGTETTLLSFLAEDGKDDKPTVLVFGSVSCPPFRMMFLKEFCEIVAEHKGAIRLVLVYLAEAHPFDGWKIGSNEKHGVVLKAHKTMEERIAAAKQLLDLQPEVKEVVVDTMGNTCDFDYEAQSSRTYVIHDKKIAYQSHLGPFQISPSSLQAFLWEWPVLKSGDSAPS